MGVFSPTVGPNTVNAGSSNTELTWTLTNQGCGDVNRVEITAPVGWVLDADPSAIYSIIDQYNPPNPGVNPILPLENTWGASGTNPVIFTAPASPPNPYYFLPLVPASPKQGNYSLVFSAIPATPGANDFGVRIIDANGTIVDRTTTVTLAPFGSGTSNSTQPRTWREDFR